MEKIKEPQSVTTGGDGGSGGDGGGGGGGGGGCDDGDGAWAVAAAAILRTGARLNGPA